MPPTGFSVDLRKLKENLCAWLLRLMRFVYLCPSTSPRLWTPHSNRTRHLCNIQHKVANRRNRTSTTHIRIHSEAPSPNQSPASIVLIPCTKRDWRQNVQCLHAFPRVTYQHPAAIFKQLGELCRVTHWHRISPYGNGKHDGMRQLSFSRDIAQLTCRFCRILVHNCATNTGSVSVS